MYHLLKGLHEYLTRSEPRLRLSRPSKATLSCYITHRKDEFSVIIIGLDGAGKSVRTATLPDSNTLLSLLFGFTQTLLEKIKTLYNDTPGLPPDKIVPTVGQNSTHYSRFSARNLFTKTSHTHIFFLFIRTAGKISLPSALLQFWDLGGQRGIRSIWPKYYGDCHAVVYVIDAVDHERLSEGWEVFGTFPSLPFLPSPSRATNRRLKKLCNFDDGLLLDTVLSAPQILGVPLLLLANKQDRAESLSVAEIRHDYEEWYQHKIESARRRQGSEMDSAQRRERIASLDVMSLSALEG